ncbi:MAG: hypothetical protein ACE5F6_00155 [Anaerolineae bacterium]
MPVTAFPSFHDLKTRSAKGGGFSDGGVVCISQPLSASPIEIAPLAGTALGGFSTPVGLGDFPIDMNLNALVMNFDPNTPVVVEAYLVFEDGSQSLIGTLPVPANTPAGYGVLPWPWLGLILTHPNKIRLKLVAESGYSLPTGRVRVKATLVEYDKPADLEAA